ncbi:MAG: hypothetical protein VX619_06425 [bacterium]|nr:hypothetical protein [bacterium]
MKKLVNRDYPIDKTSVFVGIVHFGEKDLLLDTLNYLDPNILNIWVINHNQEPLDWLDEKIGHIWNSSNPGYAAGMNKLLYQAQLENADYAILLTNDVELSMPALKLWVKMLMNSSLTIQQPILELKKGRIAAGVQYFPKEFHWPISPWRHKKLKSFSKDYYRTGFICGACFSCNMNLFRDNPVYFDQDFFMYYEDQEWSIRLSESGHSFAVNSRVCVTHGESLSSGGGIQWSGALMRWHGLKIFLSKTRATFLNRLISKILFLMRMIVLLIKYKRA